MTRLSTIFSALLILISFTLSAQSIDKQKFERTAPQHITVDNDLLVNIDDILAGNVKASALKTDPATAPANSKIVWGLSTYADLVYAQTLTTTDPYINFALVNDIDFPDSTNNWTPIGTKDIPYSGNFYGQGYTISNLSVSENSNGNGFFGYTDGAHITNLRIENASVSGLDFTAILCGNSSYSWIEHVSVSGTVSGGSNVGGICGKTYESSIYLSVSNTDITASGDNVGGIVGSIEKSYEHWSFWGGKRYYSIADCYSFGSVTGNNRIGGVVGFNLNGICGYSYTNAAVSGTKNIGGFFGRTKNTDEYTDDNIAVINSVATPERITNTTTNTNKYGQFGGSYNNYYEEAYSTNLEVYGRNDMEYSKNGQLTSFPAIKYNDGQTFNIHASLISPDDLTYDFYIGLDFYIDEMSTILTPEEYSMVIETPKDTEWCGGENGIWENENNWTNGIPNINTDASVLNNGKSSIAIDVTTHTACDILDIGTNTAFTIQPNASLTINSDVLGGKAETSFEVLSDLSGAGSLIVNGSPVNVTYKAAVPASSAIIGSPVQLPTTTHFADIQTTDGESNMGLNWASDIFLAWEENTTSASGTPGIWRNLMYADPQTGVLPMETESFEAGKGYLVAYYNRSETLVFEGSAYTSDQTVNATYSANGLNPGASYISNPFTASLAANEKANGNNNFLADNLDKLQDNAAAIYMWDNVNYSFVAINQATLGELITPGQAFYVKVDENTNLDFKKAARTVEVEETNGKSFQENCLTVTVADADGYSDFTRIYFNENATNGVDKGLDAEKIFSGSINLFANLPNGEEGDFTILALPTASQKMVIPVQVEVSNGGDYSLSFKGINSSTNRVYLKDNEKGTFQKIERDMSFEVVLNSGLNDGRFELVIKEATFTSQLGNEHKSLKGSITNIDQQIVIALDEENSGDLNIFNLSGQLVYNSTFNGDQQSYNTRLSNGYYIATLRTAEGNTLTEKVFIQN